MINAAVLTISDSVSAGARVDRSGPVVRELLEQLGWSVVVMEASRSLISEITSGMASMTTTGLERGSHGSHSGRDLGDQRTAGHAGGRGAGGGDFHHGRYPSSAAGRDTGGGTGY